MITEWHVIGSVVLCALALTYYLRVSLRRRTRLLFALLYLSMAVTAGVYWWYQSASIPADGRSQMARLAFILNYLILSMIFSALAYVNKRNE